jgi:hypothetical protein
MESASAWPHSNFETPPPIFLGSLSNPVSLIWKTDFAIRAKKWIVWDLGALFNRHTFPAPIEADTPQRRRQEERGVEADSGKSRPEKKADLQNSVDFSEPQAYA